MDHGGGRCLAAVVWWPRLHPFALLFTIIRPARCDDQNVGGIRRQISEENCFLVKTNLTKPRGLASARRLAAALGRELERSFNVIKPQSGRDVKRLEDIPCPRLP
jgi:hypothetical protein